MSTSFSRVQCSTFNIQTQFQLQHVSVRTNKLGLSKAQVLRVRNSFRVSPTLTAHCSFFAVIQAAISDVGFTLNAVVGSRTEAWYHGGHNTENEWCMPLMYLTVDGDLTRKAGIHAVPDNDGGSWSW